MGVLAAVLVVYIGSKNGSSDYTGEETPTVPEVASGPSSSVHLLGMSATPNTELQRWVSDRFCPVGGRAGAPSELVGIGKWGEDELALTRVSGSDGEVLGVGSRIPEGARLLCLSGKSIGVLAGEEHLAIFESPAITTPIMHELRSEPTMMSWGDDCFSLGLTDGDKFAASYSGESVRRCEADGWRYLDWHPSDGLDIESELILLSLPSGDGSVLLYPTADWKLGIRALSDVSEELLGRADSRMPVSEWVDGVLEESDLRPPQLELDLDPEAVAAVVVEDTLFVSAGNGEHESILVAVDLGAGAVKYVHRLRSNGSAPKLTTTRELLVAHTPQTACLMRPSNGGIIRGLPFWRCEVLSMDEQPKMKRLR